MVRYSTRMKKILVATPLKGGLSSEYVGALLRLMMWRQSNYTFQWAVTKGTSVAMARCELAKVAIDGQFDGLLFWDKDVVSKDSKQMLSMFARLLSHDVDIVGAPYVGHNVNSKFHGSADATEIRPDGLMEMTQIPIGFSLIKVDALKKIQSSHPHFTYVMKQTDDEVARPAMFEFFPNGIVGPNTGQGKVERIAALIRERENYPGINDAEEQAMADKIREIVADSDYSGNYMLGEDFYFCKMAREAGLKLYIDNNLIMPHASEVLLPVTNSDLVAEVAKEWRWKDETKPEEVFQTIEVLKRIFGPNHV